MMKITRILLLLTIFLVTTSIATAQETKPSINPIAHYKYYDDEGIQQEQDNDAFSGNAPAEATFSVNATDIEGWDCSYELVITRTASGTSTSTSEESEVVLDRYLGSEEETDYTFNEAGSYKIAFNATFVNGNDTIRQSEEDWSATCSISESNLVMPNAFCPGTGSENSIYKAKTVKSIIEFHAMIFNRWGQKLYEWNNAYEGWDGSYKGHQVKDGVYYCLVHAKGSDGRKFTIRKDVNVLRSIDPSYDGGSNTGDN